MESGKFGFNSLVIEISLSLFLRRDVLSFIYVASATYIRLLHGKIGFLGGFSALAP